MKSSTEIAIMKGLAISIILIFIFLIFSMYTNSPECYLIENNKDCGIGYYSKGDHCYYDLSLKQCCKGKNYMMKGVYGDKSCWYIFKEVLG